MAIMALFGVMRSKDAVNGMSPSRSMNQEIMTAPITEARKARATYPPNFLPESTFGSMFSPLRKYAPNILYGKRARKKCRIDRSAQGNQHDHLGMPPHRKSLSHSTPPSSEVTSNRTYRLNPSNPPYPATRNATDPA